MPVRNEAAYIERSLAAVLAQDYPASKLEVVLVDGASDDETVIIAKEVAERHPEVSVQLLTNPKRIVSDGLNLALDVCTGEFVVRVDGHCVIPPDYVRRCIETLDSTGADCVGGSWETVGETSAARAIALAQSSRVGVGDVEFRIGRAGPGPVDTVPFGAYRRQVFDELGRFDPELVRDQDDEFNYRLVRAGRVVWLEPSIVTTYFSRATIPGLWRQYFGYGFYKARVMQRHGLMSWRHVVPAAFVLATMAGALASVALANPVPVALALVPYALFISTGALIVRLRARVSTLIVVIAFIAMHVAYGLGTIWGAMALLWSGVSRWTKDNSEA